MIGRPISELAVGDGAELSRVVSQQMITNFGRTVGDDNPIHTDAAFAASFSFERTLAHGMLSAGFISAIIGTQLPGPGTLYVKQDLRFLKPVFAGDTITARVAVAEVLTDRNRIRLTTTCVNQNGDEVLTGEAWVKPPSRRIVYEGAAAPA